MAKEPRRPEDWRDWVRADYEYPEDFENLSRGQRRRAKRRWRRQDQQQRVEWLRDRRGSEPAGPGGLMIGIVFLVIVVIGFGAALPRLLHRDDAERPSVGLLTPATNPTAAPGSSATQSSETTGPSPSDSPASPSASVPTSTTPLPTTSQRVSSADINAASGIVSQWAKLFYTRNPAVETYDQLVGRAGQFTTDAVRSSFTSSGDSTYEALKRTRGTSRVLTATVVAPRPGTAPVDTPVRITRLVTVRVQITGSDPATITVPLLVTLAPQATGWLISDVNGGSGT